MGFLTEAATKLLQGTTWGSPPPPSDPLPDSDGRHHALGALKGYIEKLIFSRTGEKNAPAKPFTIAADNVMTEQPDDPKEMRFPAVSMIPARGLLDSVGLGPPDFELDSIDVFAPGTGLIYLGDWIETLTIELWASHRAERRALVSGMKVAMHPLQETWALRLKLPGYYNLVAEFTANEFQYIDEPDVIRGRRRAQIITELRVPEVVLVEVTTLKVAIDVRLVTSVQGLYCGCCRGPADTHST